MKRSIGKWGKALLVLLVFMMSSVLNPGYAAGKKKVSLDKEYFGGKWFSEVWFYTPDSIPDELSLRVYRQEVELGKEKEVPTACEIAFVSGDEHLKEAMKYRMASSDYEDEDEDVEGDDVMLLYVDNQAITEPGEAKFHIAFESSKYRAEDDYTIRVVSYSDYPAVSFTDPDPKIEMKIGDQIEVGEYYRSIVTDQVADVAKLVGMKMPQRTANIYSGSFFVSYRFDEFIERVRAGATKSYYKAIKEGEIGGRIDFEFANIIREISIPITITAE